MFWLAGNTDGHGKIETTLRVEVRRHIVLFRCSSNLEFYICVFRFLFPLCRPTHLPNILWPLTSVVFLLTVYGQK